MIGPVLTQYRSKIAELDDNIINLLIARFEITDEIGRIKKQAGIPIENKEVEKKISERFNERLEDKPSRESILKIYNEIFLQSKDRQWNI
ncbi:MAG: chorismate mutase [Candidatus Woesearchaeota archaeon]